MTPAINTLSRYFKTMLTVCSKKTKNNKQTKTNKTKKQQLLCAVFENYPITSRG